MIKKHRPLTINEPLRHRCHSAPLTRRDFLRQGFYTGAAAVSSGGVFSLFSNPRAAYAEVSGDLQALVDDIPNCSLGGLVPGAGKIPFICFDLAGGANLAGSNVLVGQGGGQMDFLGTDGYNKMGLPGDIIPGLPDAAVAGTMLNGSDGDFTNSQLGLRFHSDSAMLRGILQKFTSVAPGLVDGAVIAARSDNDTGNNPHNPMYGIAAAGAKGGVVTLIGSRSTESGSNSMSPANLIDPNIRPTKVDRPSDVTGMVDVGDLTAVLSDPSDVTAVMESMARISHKKLSLGTVTPGVGISEDEVIKDLVRCGYLRAADIAERFAGKDVNPLTDPIINSIFPGELGDREFSKTASVMKMVIDGHAGAGSITMGGYDYHTGDRQTGENRDLRAGRCIGACLEYAARANGGLGTPLMIYVYSDGSVASNGALDNSAPMGSNELGGRGKGEWTGDNSSTACAFYLVYNPTGGITPYTQTGLIDHRQVGRFTSNGSVITSSSPAANNVNLLVNTVIANYMSLNGDRDLILSPANDFFLKNHGLGDVNDVISFEALT